MNEDTRVLCVHIRQALLMPGGKAARGDLDMPKPESAVERFMELFINTVGPDMMTPNIPLDVAVLWVARTICGDVRFVVLSTLHILIGVYAAELNNITN